MTNGWRKGFKKTVRFFFSGVQWQKEALLSNFNHSVILWVVMGCCCTDFFWWKPNPNYELFEFIMIYDSSRQMKLLWHLSQHQGFPEKLWMIHPWKCSRIVWRGSGQPGPVEAVPGHGMGLELDDPQDHFQTILWFHENIWGVFYTVAEFSPLENLSSLKVNTICSSICWIHFK